MPLRKINRRQTKPTAKLSTPVDTDLILRRVKVRSFTQCRAVASKILKELINGTLPSDRVRFAVPILQVIVACNQSVHLRQRLERLQQALQLDLAPTGEDAEEVPIVEDDGAAPEAGWQDDGELGPEEEADDDPDRNAQI